MNNPTFFLLPLVLLAAYVYFLSRRQKKAVRTTAQLHASLQIGDRIHTTAGLEATIAGIGENTIDLEIAPGVITTWMKLAIHDRIAEESDEDIEYETDEFIEEEDEETDERIEEKTEEHGADKPGDARRLTTD